jgi:hypothetical protein
MILSSSTLWSDDSIDTIGQGSCFEFFSALALFPDASLTHCRFQLFIGNSAVRDDEPAVQRNGRTGRGGRFPGVFCRCLFNHHDFSAEFVLCPPGGLDVLFSAFPHGIIDVKCYGLFHRFAASL